MAINIERKQFPLSYVQQHSRAVMGWGAHQMVAQECQMYGITNALIVTTGLRGTGIVDEIVAILSHAGISSTVFDGVTSNPKDFECKAGAEAYIKAECNGIVSVGGGSSSDAGKAIRIMVENDGPDTKLRDFAAFLDPHYTTKIPTYKFVNIPHVAINTTTGTGAECTAFAIINDEDWKYKLILIVPGVSPSVGINDPALMRMQPPHLVAWTGIDAFCHSMEPFIGRINMPVVSGVALNALELISKNLREAHANPANDVAIENMAWAQYIASMSYNIGGGMGMVHGLAHQLSALKDLHHGYANALMLLPVERFNSIGSMEKFKQVGMALGLDLKYTNPVKATDMTLEAIERLRNDVGIEQKPFSEFDLSDADIDHAIKWSLNDISREANPRDINGDQVREIFKAYI